MCIRLPHTLLHASSMEKELKSKCSKILLNQKHQNEAIIRRLRRNEAVKEEYMVKNHEDAYRLKKIVTLLLNMRITEVRKQKLWGNLISMVYFHVGGVL